MSDRKKFKMVIIDLVLVKSGAQHIGQFDDVSNILLHGQGRLGVVRRKGRVFTMMNSLLNLTGPIGLVFAGPVSDWVGLQVWYVAAGVLCGVLGVLGFFIPAIMNVEENNNGAAAVGAKMPTANAATVPMATD